MENTHHQQPTEATAEPIAPPHEPAPSFNIDGAGFDDDVSSSHREETVQIELAPYSLTRKQVSERYAAAGFKVEPRTVSLYGQQGRLRAQKVPARNGLERYLFDPASVDEDIAKRRHEAEVYSKPETIYAVPSDDAARAPEHGANGASHLPALSLHAELHDREIKIAVLSTELHMEREARVRAERRAEQQENRSLALAQQLGKYKERIAMLEAPKTEKPSPEAGTEPESAGSSNGARPPASFWRRLFGGS